MDARNSSAVLDSDYLDNSRASIHHCWFCAMCSAGRSPRLSTTNASLIEAIVFSVAFSLALPSATSDVKTAPSVVSIKPPRYERISPPTIEARVPRLFAIRSFLTNLREWLIMHCLCHASVVSKASVKGPTAKHLLSAMFLRCCGEWMFGK